MNLALLLPWYTEPPRYIRDAIADIRKDLGIEKQFIIEERAGMTRVRGGLAIAFLASNADVALCIDADIVPAYENALQVLAHARDHDVVSGNYYKRDGVGPSWIPTKKGLYHNGPKGGVVDCRYVGMGFTAIRRSAFEKAAEFAPEVNGERIFFAEQKGRSNRWLPEDYSFCERVRRGKGSVVVDTTVLVGHLPRKPTPIYPPEWEVEVDVPEETDE